MCDTQRKRLFNILLPFSLLIPGTPYIRSSEILSKYLVASSKHFGLPPNYALGSSSSNHPQRTIESYAKAVNFTFDNSNIR
jgi:hypothetical protein